MPDSRRVLLAGESWVSTTTHVKGFDSFTTSTYAEGADDLAIGEKERFGAETLGTGTFRAGNQRQRKRLIFRKGGDELLVKTRH